MKRLMLIMSMLILAGCGNPHSAPIGVVEVDKPQMAEESKRIIAKMEPIERAHWGADFATTGYYLAAGDGTVVKVRMGVYAKTNVGDMFTSSRWEYK